LNCGTCTSPQTCGGGGQSNVCGSPPGCQPTTCAAAGRNCGLWPDGCGAMLNCGGCGSGESCGGGGVPGVCGSAGYCSALGGDCWFNQFQCCPGTVCFDPTGESGCGGYCTTP
jgi:hypothetical protein